MNIQELEDKHKTVIGESDLYIPDYLYGTSDEELPILYKEEEEFTAKEATKLSVEFAIEILNSIQPGQPFIDINDKIQELKKYLDEKS